MRPKPKVEVSAVPAIALQPVVPGKTEARSVVKVGCCGGVCGGGAGPGPGPARGQMAGRRPLAAQGALYSPSGEGGMKRPERDRGFTLEAGLWPDELNFNEGPEEGEIPEGLTPRPALAEQAAPEEADSPAPPVDPELGGVVAQAQPAWRPAREEAGGEEEAAAPIEPVEPQAASLPAPAQDAPAQPARRARILDELFPPAYAGVPVQ